MLMGLILCFFLITLKQVNAVVTTLYVLDVVKNLNVKVFNLVSGTNEKRRIEWHETCKCKCNLGILFKKANVHT